MRRSAGTRFSSVIWGNHGTSESTHFASAYRRHVYHRTHRCHDREFLLGFQKDRNAYRDWMREGSGRHALCVLGYCITSNHVHVVVVAPGVKAVSHTMQLAAGCSAGRPV